MPSEKHQGKIKEIRNAFERAGWICSEDVPVVRDKGKPIDNEIGKIDLCCEKYSNLSCFEIENGSQFQAVKNARDLNEMGKLARQKRRRYRKCQLGSHENWKEVCK